MTGFFAETHPSQPNYLAMFSGDTQGVGVTDDSLSAHVQRAQPRRTGPPG